MVCQAAFPGDFSVTTLEVHPPSNAHHGKQQQQIAAFQLGQTRHLGQWIGKESCSFLSKK